MAKIQNLPSEIYSHILRHFVLEYHEREEQFPLRHYSSSLERNSPGQDLAALTHVCQSFRTHSLPVLWKDLSVFYVEDLQKLYSFMNGGAGLHCGKYVHRLLFSWLDPEINKFGAEQDPNIWYGDSELGEAQDWIFMNRVEWYRTKMREEAKASNSGPGWSGADVKHALGDEIHDPPWTSGPDGTGVIPGLRSVQDVAKCFESLISHLPSLKHLEFNSRMFPLYIPVANGMRLKTLTIFNEDRRAVDRSIFEHQRTVENLEILHELGPIEDLEPKVDAPFLQFAPITPSNPIGMAFRPQLSLNPTRVYLELVCRRIFDGVTNGPLRTIKIVSWDILRFEKILPLLFSLDTLHYPQDGIQPVHHWDWHWGPDHAVLCKSIAEFNHLRARLYDSDSLDALRATCENIKGDAITPQPRMSYTRQEIADLSSRLNRVLFASWVLDSPELAERVYQAIRLSKARGRSENNEI